MTLTRRNLLRVLAAAPVGAMGACCLSKYPKPIGEARVANNLMPALLAPKARARAAINLGPIIDVHAHFFNASDVAVRGFLEECLGHRAPPSVRLLLKALARISDRLAGLAPTAADELADLSSMVGATANAADVQDVVATRLERERQAAAQRVADAIRNSDFQRHYRRMKQSQSAGPGQTRTGPVSPGEIRQVVSEAERPSPPGAPAAPAAPQDADADVADGMLGFLHYMLSPRWTNLRSYMKAFTTDENAFGVDKVLGALVDFDYWLDCPPRSAHDDQVRLHQRLYELNTRTSEDGSANAYFHPIVAYNPWTDINQDGAALARVVNACSKGNFVAVKIYPPTGFRPAGNATIGDVTKKRRPDLKKLDATLKAFFEKCAELRIPVLAHSARSNGRDDAHDDFGGPRGWVALLTQYAKDTEAQIVDFGHFGGGQGSMWTQEFADLISQRPRMSLYADLGYWEELMCSDTPNDLCLNARERLKKAMKVPIAETNQTVLDRTMFASDWLMLSQVKHWADYPNQLYESLRNVLDMNDDDVAKVFGGNAKKCFRL
jgi:predicted TIM-barrel fold metal-dependent hydrolase